MMQISFLTAKMEENILVNNFPGAELTNIDQGEGCILNVQRIKPK